MKTSKIKKRKSRWKVAVLVRCSIPKVSDDLVDLEMWAKDVNEGGMKLELNKGLAVSQMHKEGENTEGHRLRFDDISFKKGTKIKIQDLFYDDEGSPFIEGKVSWAKLVGGTWNLGVQFDDPKSQPKALLESFRDFLDVVKNPVEAIKKASRK